MEQKIQERIARAKEILKIARHASMATVNADGSPHNTPFYLILDEKLEHIYWASHPDSMHCQNIQRTGQLFVVVYDMIEPGGLFMKAEDGHELSGEELEVGLNFHNITRARDGNKPLSLEYYTTASPQRMYSARITNFWINHAERGNDGRIVRDYRHEIQAKDLLT